MKITLCMIVKNEEKDIRACLERAFQIVDDAIVVDTGSTDETLSILESMKESYPLEIRKHDWENDFSKARNESIRNATGDYILILDADERIFSNRNELEAFLSKTDSISYSVPIYNVYENKQIIRSNMMIRIYKNINPSYEGAIHEQILINGNKTMGNKVPSEVCKVYHFGYSKVAFIEKDKSKRNLDIIMSEIEKKPEEPFNWYNKGVMEMIAGHYDTALDDFIKSHRLCNGVRMTFHNDLVIRMLQCMFSLKQYKKGINFAKELVKDPLVSKLPDLYFYYGYMLKEKNQYDLAIRQFRKCIQIGDVEQDSSKLGMGSFIPLIEWARILKNQNLIHDAIQKYQEAVNHPLNYIGEGTQELNALVELNHLSFKNIEIKDFECNNKEKKDLNSKEMVIYRMRLKQKIQSLIDQGQLEDAKQIVYEYEQIVKEDIDLYSIKGVIAMIEGDLNEAEKNFLMGLALCDQSFDLSYNLGYLYQSQNRAEKAIKFYKQALLNAKDTTDKNLINESLYELGYRKSEIKPDEKKVVESYKESQKEDFIELINTDDKEVPRPGYDLLSNRENVYNNLLDKKFKRATIIILGYNRLQKTKYCVECVLKYTKNVDYELVLIDNGSNDGTYEYFKSVDFKDKRIIRITKNLGVSFPMLKLGVEKFKGKYIVFLPNDAYVTSNWLSNLLMCMESDSKIGWAMPMSSNISNLQDPGLTFNSLEDMQEKAKVFNKSDPSKWEKRLRLISVVAIFKREIFDLVGKFDGGFFHDFGEDDYCIRLRRMGYKLILCGDTFIHHDHDFSSLEARDPSMYKQSLEIGRINYKEKHYGLDAWEDINNYEKLLVGMLPEPKSKNKQHKVLGIDVRCGTPILEIENFLIKYNMKNIVCSAFTTQAKYFLDLQTVCNGYVWCDRIDYLNEYIIENGYDYIIIGEPINNYIQPIKVLDEVMRGALKGSKILFKANNDNDISNYLEVIEGKQLTSETMYSSIALEEIFQYLNSIKSIDIKINTELYNVDENTVAKLREYLEVNRLNECSGNRLQTILTKEYLICVEIK